MAGERTSIPAGIRNVIVNLLCLVSPAAAPFVLELVFSVVQWNGWSSVLALLLTAIVCMCAYALVTYWAGIDSMWDLGKFLCSRDLARYENVKTRAFFEVFGPDHGSRRAIKRDPASSKMVNYYRRKMLTNDAVKIYSVRPDSDGGWGPSQILTFINPMGCWMFLPWAPHEMSGMDKYKFLHELGHVAPRAFNRATIAPRSELVVTTLLLLAVVARMEVDTISSLLLLTIVVLYVIRHRFDTKNRPGLVVADEIQADYFGLIQSDVSWFKEYPAELLAQRFCGIRGIDEQLISIRRRAFVSVLEGLRQGQPPKHVNDYLPKKLSYWPVRVTEALIAVSLLSTLFWYLPPSYLMLGLLGAASVAMLAVGLILIFLGRVMAEMFTMNTDGREFPQAVFNLVRENKRTLGGLMRRSPVLRRRLERVYLVHCMLAELGFRRLERERTPRHSISHLPALFAPNEVEIIATRDAGGVTVVHEREIDYRMTHVEFDEEQATLSVHYRRGKVYQLGVQIEWTIRAYFEDSSTVTFSRRDGETVMEQSEVPMRIVKFRYAGVIGAQSPTGSADPYERAAELRKIVERSGEPSGYAVTLARATVDRYSDDEAMELLRSTANADLVCKPAFCKALLDRLGL